MLLRQTSAPNPSSEANSGRPQLTLATWLLLIEAILRTFARPLFVAALFIGLAWTGVLTALYPWAHLVALALFIILFFDAIGRATLLWRRPTLSLAMRRVEAASRLYHRPLDVLIDRPATADADAHTLWQEHVLRARAQTRKLRWPSFDIDWAARDPHRLRYIAAAFLTIGLIVGWGALGGRLIAAINPALGKIPASTAAIDAWIVPPEYTHLSPIMIATPAGERLQNEVIKVPEGSVLHAHLAEKDGDTPVLEVNNQSVEFSAEDEKDFNVTAPVTGGTKLAIQRGWLTLAAWKIQVVPDTAPQIAFSETPSSTERKDTRIAYDAKDDYGVTSVALRITPRQALFGIDPEPMEFSLATADEKDLKRVDFQDLTAQVWAGTEVDAQLIATDAAGHRSESDKVAFTLPEKIFFQPIARLLIEERKKLLNNMLSGDVRNETANLMAGLARQPATFGGDPVVMMALRAGAVRLVLDHEREAALSAQDILWKAATRIEDGAIGTAEQNLKQAQKDLADALDRNASEQDVQALIERLHQALARYLAQLSTRMAGRPVPPDDLHQLMGARINVLTPQDLEKMLNDMRNQSAAGSRDAVRNELAKLSELLENVSMQNPALSREQQQALEQLRALRALTRDQQALLDHTFQQAQTKNPNPALAKNQDELLKRLRDLMGGMKEASALPQGADAMQRAESRLQQGSLSAALPSQNEALEALRNAEQAMMAQLRESLAGMPMGGGGSAGNDPFGREGGNGLAGEPDKIHAPDRFEARRAREILDEIQQRASDLNRSKTERDYIERLLQNF